MNQVGIVGLGRVGRHLAATFAIEGFEVVGYDVDPEAVYELTDVGLSPDGSLGEPAQPNADDVTLTTDPADLHGCEYVLIAVPTPVDDQYEPDVDSLAAAGRTVGKHLSEGATVVLESTIYPGGTRDVLIPALETGSDREAGEDFSVGYSPERINPGGTNHTLRDVAKIVAGLDEKTRKDLVALYERIVDATVQPAPTIEVAEAAKCLENVQRDVNVALVNEFAMAASGIEGLDAEAVLEAAGTKWNFHDYRPGLVNGHCIPVDPYYLVHRFEREDVTPELMRTARTVNDRVAEHVAQQVIDLLAQRRIVGEDSGPVVRIDGGQRADGATARHRDEHACQEASVLLAGLSYKPGLDDVRAPTTRLTIDTLRARDLTLVGYDPYADPGTVEETFEIPAQESFDPSGFDALVICTPHAELVELDLQRLVDEMADGPALVDVSGAFDEVQAREAGFTYRGLL